MIRAVAFASVFALLSDTCSGPDQGRESADTKSQRPTCEADDLAAGKTVKRSSSTDPAPLYEGGTPPAEGHYELSSWTIYDSTEESEASMSAVYRFSPGNVVDANVNGVSGRMTWVMRGDLLVVEVVCPAGLKGAAQAFRLAYEGEALILSSEDGVMVLRRKS